MLRELKLTNFKAFETFTVTFGEQSILVGANNAGKSTIVSALRLLGRLTRIAKRSKPSFAVKDDGITQLAYPFSGETVGLLEENLRHEFRDVEVRVNAKFASDLSITAVWPRTSVGQEAQDPYFYLNTVSGPPRRPSIVKQKFPEIGIIPVLSPLEQSERLLDATYVRSNVDGRLTSRHVRNQLYLLSLQDGETDGTELDEFLSFAAPWLPEMKEINVRPNFETPDGALDLYYLEPGARTEREIHWSGDGLQVWLQILLHFHRLKGVPIILLDEPDIYLHADLQRRLVRLLEEFDSQAITATHSSEMISEASPAAITWVDKSRRRAVRAPKDENLRRISESLGTAFNLHLARALRSRVALFVEGQDMRVVRSLARRVGATSLANEQGLAIIKLEGFSRWDRIEPFKWLLDTVLEQSLNVWILLDRDYRLDEKVSSIDTQLREVGVKGHIWRRKELESYLLEPPALARCFEVSEAHVEETLWRVTGDMKSFVFSRFLAEVQQAQGARRVALQTTIERFSEEFDRDWTSLDWRLRRGPAKDILSALNRELQGEGKPSVSHRKLANSMRRNELADELTELLLGIEGDLLEE